jgi:hypothetical protein
MTEFVMRAGALSRPALATVGVSTAAVGLVALGVSNPLAAIVAAYVLLFWFLAWNWPHVALMLIFASTPFQNDLSGDAGFARFSAAEANLMLALPVFVAHMLLRRRLPAMGPITIPILMYVAVCGYSSAITWRPDSAPLSLLQMILFLFVSVMMFSAFTPRADSLRLCLHGMLVTSVALSGVVIASGTGYVLGLHKNGTGPSLAIGLIIAVELWFASRGRGRRWLYVLTAAAIAPGLIITLSRGAWLAAAVGLGVLTALRRQYGLLLKLAIVLVPLIAFGWSTLPKDSREYATDIRQDRYNIQARYDNLAIAHRFFERSPVYGCGVGIRKEYDATNIFWFTLAETGALGLAAFALVNLVFAGMALSASRRISREDPYFSMLAVGAALVISTLARGMVDHYWQRGPAFAAWAAAGMAVAVYTRSRECRAAPEQEY